MTATWCTGWRRPPHAVEDVHPRGAHGVPLCPGCELARLRDLEPAR